MKNRDCEGELVWEWGGLVCRVVCVKKEGVKIDMN